MMDKRTCSCGKEFQAFTEKQKICGLCIREKSDALGNGEHRAFPICPCGNKTNAKGKLYCSEECKTLYKRHKDKRPDRVSVCQAAQCGKVFTRPAGFPGPMKYCSVEHSNSSIRRNQKESALDIGNGYHQIFKNPWEMRFWVYCHDNNISCESWGVRPGLDTPTGPYYPDFIVMYNGKELVVDIKGEVHDHFQNKMTYLSGLGTNITLVGKEDLKDMSKGNFSALDGNGRTKYYGRDVR